MRYALLPAFTYHHMLRHESVISFNDFEYLDELDYADDLAVLNICIQAYIRDKSNK